MEITYSNDKAIFDLLQDLLDDVKWQIFKEFMMNRMSISSLSTTATSITTLFTPLTFNDVTKLFTEKANAIIGRWKLAGPGFKFANIAVMQGAGSNIKINPAIGLCMHCNNPKGVKCTNTLCANLPHADNHDLAHCYWPGGGMESKALAWICSKSQKPETAAVVMATPSDPSLPCELSCTMVTKLPDNDTTV